MFRKFSTVVLIAAAEYVAVAGILLLVLYTGGPTAEMVGALGAALAALAALLSLVIGKRLGRREAAEIAAQGAPPDAGRNAALGLAAAAASGASPRGGRRPSLEAPRRSAAPPAALARELSFLSHFFVDVVESLPIGFATLDRNFVVRSANRALKRSLGIPSDEPVIGLSVADTPLGAAIYNGSRTLLAGRPFDEIVREIVDEEGGLDLAPLLVPGEGELWAARLRVRLQPWPALPAPTEQYLLWVEEIGAPAESFRPSVAASATAPAAAVAPASAPALPHAPPHEPPIPPATLPSPEPLGAPAPIEVDFGPDPLVAEISLLREKLLDEMLARDALLASIPIGVLVVDDAGVLLGWSDSVADLLGAEIAPRDGAAVRDAWPALRATGLTAALAALLEDGTPFEAPLPLPLVSRAGAARRDRTVRGVPVGIPGVAPRRALLLLEERWDPALLVALEAEAAAARGSTRRLAARLPEIRSRLDTVSSIARFLAATLVGADIRTLSEIKMIEIQRGRIEEALLDAAEGPASPPKSA